MTCDIFVRSYAGDFEWLTYCLRSIQRFAKGFRKTIVVVPHGQHPPTGTAETVFFIHEKMDGYLDQQSCKLHADSFTDADYILYTDSDTIFTREITPSDCVDGNRANWLYTPYSSLTGDNAQFWRAVTEKAMKRPVEFEFMRRHPFCVPRWALEGLRQWFWRVHGMSLENYIAAQPSKDFSEWNIMGAWLWNHHRERINWTNTDVELGVPFVHQHWSHGGFSDEIQKNLELALA